MKGTGAACDLFSGMAPGGVFFCALTADRRDRSMASGRAAARGGATPAAGAACGGVAHLAGEGGQLPLGAFRAAFRAGDGDLLVTAPEEHLEALFAFTALVFKNRHGFIPRESRASGVAGAGGVGPSSVSIGIHSGNGRKCQGQSPGCAVAGGACGLRLQRGNGASLSPRRISIADPEQDLSNRCLPMPRSPVQALLDLNGHKRYKETLFIQNVSPIHGGVTVSTGMHEAA